MANLYNSAKEGVDTTDVLSFPTGYEPKAHDFYELLNSPALLSYRTPTADPDYDDSTLEDMLYRAHRAQAYHSVREDLSVSLSSSSMSDRTGRPVGDRPGDPVSTKAQKHRLGLYLMSKNRKFLQNAKQELINTNFKQLKPKKSNNFFKDNCCSKIWNYVKLIREVSLKWKS